jgi:hypothetical protein
LSALPWVLLIFKLFYGGVLAINSLLLDASTSPSAVPRYLLPLYVALLLFVLAEGGRLIREVDARPLTIASVFYVAAIIALNGMNTLKIIQQPLATLGYTGDRIRSSQLVRALEQLEPDQPILSNNPELVYILASRPAYVRPIRYDHYQERFRQDYEEQLQSAQEKLSAGGVLLIFKPVEAVDEVVIKRSGVVELADYDQAVIFGMPGVLPVEGASNTQLNLASG